MKNWIKWLLYGRTFTAEEREERRRAKIMMLGASAGSALKAGSNGLIKIETKHENVEVRNVPGA